MILRYVKMTFQEDKVEDFQKLFESRKEKIRAFPGCTHLELWNDIKEPNIFCTYSHWEKEEDLENYRHSELFKDVWSKTKVLFKDKPIASSYEQKVKLP